MLAKLPPERQVLLDAANILEERGWIQGGFGNASRGYCMMGAIGETRADENWQLMAMIALNQKFGQPMEQWNDTPGRTKEEVIAMLRETALEGL
jgi:hypothetical protein